MADTSAPDLLPITAARAHLRVGSGVADGDIAPLVLAATGRIEGFLARPLVGADGWPTVSDVPAIVVHSVKLALSDFWVNREAPQLTDDQLRPIIGRYQRLSIA